MKIVANYRAKQMIALQTIILVFFAVSMYNLGTKNYDLTNSLPYIVCVIGIVTSLISIAGMCIYVLQFYLSYDGDILFRNGFALKKRHLDMKSIGGYTIDQKDNLRLRSPTGEGLLDIHCCYLSKDDRRAFLGYVEQYGGEMKLAPKKSMLSSLLTPR